MTGTLLFLSSNIDRIECELCPQCPYLYQADPSRGPVCPRMLTRSVQQGNPRGLSVFAILCPRLPADLEPCGSLIVRLIFMARFPDRRADT